MSLSEKPDWLDYIDHTADAGITVRANSMKKLFSRAAWGMFSVITDMRTVQPKERELVSIDALDREALMVEWLSELNYRHVTRGKVFCKFEMIDLNGHSLAAEIHGEVIDPQHHTVYTEIKAVTFHGLVIEKTQSHWHAHVIFDL